MQTVTKSWLTRIAGNALIFLAMAISLATTATPDSGPAPSTRTIVLIVLFACAPLFAAGVWLLYRSRHLKVQSEMESCIQEPDRK